MSTQANTTATVPPPDSWTAYYDRNTTSPPDDNLITVLDRIDAEGGGTVAGPRFAVDLGCGQGRDTVELLRRGWRVLAIDADTDGIARLRRDLAEDAGDRLETRLSRFEEQTWPPADLVNASLSLGWCGAGRFAGLWRQIENSVRPGGWFCGQFHGVNDSGGGFPTTTRLSGADVDELFANWDVEIRREEEVDSMTPFGIPKRRHLHYITARRR